jgi:DNA-binding transcriptional MerR regulator/methylmalonyl-CoA mutase cobalamin-binding subunit
MPARARREGPDAPRYPLRNVTRRTGLTAARLRAWESRHGVVAPSRSGGGQRLYSDDDIERLLLLRRAVEAGHAIGSIARLDRDALERLAAGEPGAGGLAGPVPDMRTVEVMMGMVARLDGPGLERALRTAMMRLGPIAAMDRILGPLLRRLGEQWHAGILSPAHEHAASDVVRRVLHWVRTYLRPAPGAATVVVGTPRGERHEIGAQMAAAAAADLGWRVVYLGPDLPARDFAAAVRQVRASAIALSLLLDEGAVLREVAAIGRGAGAGVRLVAGGTAAARHRSRLERSGWTVAAEIAALRDALGSRR